LNEVVFSLGQIWGVNVVAGAGVDGTVSGVFEDASLAEVLDAVLGANGYGYKLSGRSLIIQTLDKIGADDPNLRRQTLQLPAAITDHEAVVKAAELLLSSRGRLQMIPNSGSVLIIDFEENLQRVTRFFAELSQQSTMQAPANSPPTTTPSTSNDPNPNIAATIVNNGPKAAYYAPQFTAAQDLEGPLTAALGQSASISLIPNENRIMIIGSPEQLEMAGEIIRTLDIPRPQVRIAALIYDVELRRGEQLGIDWGKTLSINGSFGGDAAAATAGGTTGGTTGGTGGAGGGTGGATDAAASAAATGVAVTLGTLQDTLTLGSVIKALDETRGAHLLADPTITVADRSEANIKIVTKIPYQQLTQTQQGGNIGTTAFEEAGITLTVTPRIARDGTIQMRVRPEFSTLVEYINGQPLIDSRAAETDVRIADRHTLVIGGLRRKQARDAITGIPGLMNIHKIGRLFGAHDSGVSESELIVFLRPEIVTPYQPMDVRGQAAALQGNQQLDAIPVATHCPLVPDCKDHHCVYHHPRPNVNGGSPGHSQYGDFLMIGGDGLESWYDPLPGNTMNPSLKSHHDSLEEPVQLPAVVPTSRSVQQLEPVTAAQLTPQQRTIHVGDHPQVYVEVLPPHLRQSTIEQRR
jgi:general secretion pathway protein D